MAEPSASALRVAVKALTRRELSTAELRSRLTRAGIGAEEASAVIEHLCNAGYLSDARAASERARILAARHLGDRAIAVDLARRGVPPAAIEAALAEVPPEIERAQALADRLGVGLALARTLRNKGYSAEAIESVLGEVVADGP